MIRRIINHFNLCNQPISIYYARKANILLFQFLKCENLLLFSVLLSTKIAGSRSTDQLAGWYDLVSLVIVKKTLHQHYPGIHSLLLAAGGSDYLSTPPQFHNFELTHLNGDCLTHLAFSEHLFGGMKITDTISKKLSAWMHFVQTAKKQFTYHNSTTNTADGLKTAASLSVLYSSIAAVTQPPVDLVLLSEITAGLHQTCYYDFSINPNTQT